MKKIAGYLFLLLSFGAWGIIALLPFIDISKGQVAGFTTALVIVGEAAFLVSIALLGKDAWQCIKVLFEPKK